MFAPLFALAVVVQFNDPDPFPWITIYGCATALCLVAAAGRTLWRAPVALVLVALPWMLTLVPSVLAFLRSDHEPVAFYMKAGNALEEQAREAGGLFLVVAWFSVFALYGWRTRLATRALPKGPLSRIAIPEAPPSDGVASRHAES